jgi:hypothetical protein
MINEYIYIHVYKYMADRAAISASVMESKLSKVAILLYVRIPNSND